MKSQKDIENLLIAFGECFDSAKCVGNELAAKTFSRSIDILLWVLEKDLTPGTKEVFDILSSKSKEKIKDWIEKSEALKEKKKQEASTVTAKCNQPFSVN